MEIQCKKVTIDSMDGRQIFEVGKPYLIFTIDYITVDFTNKIVMIRDADNMKKIFSFIHLEADIEPNITSKTSVNIRSLI